MANNITGEAAALALVGVGEVFQIMASMLPSPTTAMKGGNDPSRIKQLRRNEIQGAVIAISLAGGVSYFVGKEDKSTGILLFTFAALTLALFLYEYERALKLAETEGNTGHGY
jgi:hypothetical protein